MHGDHAPSRHPGMAMRLVVSRPLPESPQALFVSYSSALGGAERILLDRAGAVSSAVIACPPGALADAARERGLEVAGLRARRAQLRGSARDRLGAPLRLAGQAAEVRAAVTRYRPGCVVGWSMRGLLSSVAATSAVRGAPPLVFAQNDLLPSPGVARAVRTAARRCRAVVALSQVVADDLGVAEATVIHPGVDLHRFSAAPLPDGPPRVLLLGALVGWKRPGLALEIVARTNATLHVAGAPLDAAGAELLAELRHRAEQPDLRGRVQIPGHSQDSAAALAQATCLLHCADREPFGMVMAEALARGRPVAAPAAAGPLEIVDRSCGSLYRPGDADAGAHALTEVLERAAELVAPARARAEERFDVQVSNRRFAELIAGVAR